MNKAKKIEAIVKPDAIHWGITGMTMRSTKFPCTVATVKGCFEVHGPEFAKFIVSSRIQICNIYPLGGRHV